MISPPSNLSVDKIYQILDETGVYVNRVSLSFDKPTDPDIVGIILFFSFDGFSNYYLSTHLLKDLAEENGRIYVEKNLVDLCDGRRVDFKLKFFTYYNEYSDFSNIITTITLSSVPKITDIYYDSKKVVLSYEEINTSLGLNSEFLNYRIYREKLNPIKAQIIENNDDSILFSSDSFKEGRNVAVYNPFKKIMWKGIVEYDGIFTINTNNNFIFDLSFSYKEASSSDFTVYIEDSPTFLIDTTNIEIQDSNIEIDSFYLYKVKTVTPSGESLSDDIIIYTPNFYKTHPVLRRLEQSNPNILSEYWKTMKDSLYDENFYKKEIFDIPFIEKKYSHILYIGIANLNVDVWLNDEYIGRYITNSKGEIQFDLKLRKKENILKVRLSNFDFTLSNSTPFQFQINTYLMYIFFLVFGLKLLTSEDDISVVIQNSFLTTTNDSLILEKYGKLVSLFRVIGWTFDQFKETIQKLFIAFNYPGVKKGLEEVLNAFDVVDRFDIWEYLEPWRTIRVGDFLTTKGYITNENFLYGVSACKYNGEETTPTLVRFDKRWVDPHWISVNSFEWDKVEGADFYRIYRGTTEIDLELLTSTGSTRFIDYNNIIPNPSKAPLNYNYSSMEPPKEIRKIYVPKVREEEFFYYSNGWLKVIVFGKREFLDGEKELIASLIRKIIPCHLKLDIVFATVYGSSEFDVGYGYNYGWNYGIGL